MAPILVAYTTQSGSTGEVAQAIAAELEKCGQPAEAVRLEEITSLESYSAVVIGAPMILGWHRSAQRFVKKHRAALSQKRVAYFLTAMSLTQTGETEVDRTPLCVDSGLAKPPAHPGRLSFKENYATLKNYLRPVLKAAPQVKPVSIAVFGGKLELFRLPILQTLFVMAVIQAKPGDFRDWDFIRKWAAGLAPLLAGPTGD